MKSIDAVLLVDLKRSRPISIVSCDTTDWVENILTIEYAERTLISRADIQSE